MPAEVRTEGLLRELAPQVLGILVRRHGQFDACEDAVQEALLAAALQWEQDGVPDNPRGWLLAVANRRLIDEWRASSARQRREETAAVLAVTDPTETPDRDDTLTLLFLCCHPALSAPSQLALTLRAVGGLTTAEIAAAFLVPEATMAQRLSRARATLRAAGARFAAPVPKELPARVASCLEVLHLVFNEGYAASSGPQLLDTSLTAEAIRLTRGLHAALPDHDEVTGALALMLLTSAREATRTDDRGDLVPLAEQDRSRWDADLVAEGVALLEAALPRGHLGRFQLQAAIAAVHAEAATWAETDWRQISLLYGMLEQLAPSPAVTLNRAVAVGMACGPQPGLAVVEGLLDDPAMARHHRTHAVRAHLLEMAGERGAALEAYERAARMTASIPEQRYLNARVRRLRQEPIP